MTNNKLLFHIVALSSIALQACPPSAPTRTIIVTATPDGRSPYEPGGGDTGGTTTGDGGGTSDGGTTGDSTSGGGTTGGATTGGGTTTGAGGQVRTFTLCRGSFFVSEDDNKRSCYLTAGLALKVLDSQTHSPSLVRVALDEAPQGCALSDGLLFASHFRTDDKGCP